MARLTQRLSLSRYDADEHYKQALLHYHQNKISDAILSIEQAIQLLPNQSEYYAARGFFYLEDGVNKKAESDFDRALVLHAYEVLAHYGRGIMAYKEKRWNQAVECFTLAYQANPKRPETLYYLALAHHHKTENKDALSYMEKAESIFKKQNDKRQKDADKWVKELKKLIQ